MCNLLGLIPVIGSIWRTPEATMLVRSEQAFEAWNRSHQAFEAEGLEFKDPELELMVQAFSERIDPARVQIGRTWSWMSQGQILEGLQLLKRRTEDVLSKGYLSQMTYIIMATRLLSFVERPDSFGHTNRTQFEKEFGQILTTTISTLAKQGIFIKPTTAARDLNEYLPRQHLPLIQIDVKNFIGESIEIETLLGQEWTHRKSIHHFWSRALDTNQGNIERGVRAIQESVEEYWRSFELLTEKEKRNVLVSMYHASRDDWITLPLANGYKHMGSPAIEAAIWDAHNGLFGIPTEQLNDRELHRAVLWVEETYPFHTFQLTPSPKKPKRNTLTFLERRQAQRAGERPVKRKADVIPIGGRRTQ